MAEQLEQMSMSVLKCASSPHTNPFVTYVKEILSTSTKNTATELLINRVCQLILSSWGLLHHLHYNLIENTT